MPGPIDYSSPDTALLRELLNRRPSDYVENRRDPLDATGNPDLPSVPHPSGFRPDPLINGSPRLANMVNDVFRVAPELRGRVNLISTAPTPSITDLLQKSGFPISGFNVDNVNVVGQHDMPRKAIWLRHDDAHFPFSDIAPMESTLGHEFGHTGNIRGHNYAIPRDTDMDLIELLSAKVLKRPQAEVPEMPTFQSKLLKNH